MKPTFALTLDEDSIGLLQRTPQGWLSLGSVAFGAADMDEALASLRDKAAALSDGPLTTKLVIPNDQILYDRVSASGPSRAARKAQIAAALAGRTPYALDDLTYDWAGDGPEVDVAAVATETLSEAESFAKTHGFNPVAFVAVPPSGQFMQTEPWFGTTEHFEDLPFKGDLTLSAEAPITIFDPEAPLASEVEAKTEEVEEAEAPLAPEVEKIEEVEAPEPEAEPATEAPESASETPQDPPAAEVTKTARLSLNALHFPTIPSFTEADDTSTFGEKGNPFFDMLAARAQTRSEPQDALAPAPIEPLPDLHAAFADDESALSIDMAVGSRSGNLLDFDDYDAAEPQFEPHKPAAQHIELEEEIDGKTGASDFKEDELLEIPQAFWNSIDLANAPPEVRATEPQAFEPITPPLATEAPEPVLEPALEVQPEPVPLPVEDTPEVPLDAPTAVVEPSQPTEAAPEAPFNELAEPVPEEAEPPVTIPVPPVVPPLPIPPRVVQPNRGEPRPLAKPTPGPSEPALHEGGRRGAPAPRLTPPAQPRPEGGIEVGKGSGLRAQANMPSVTPPMMAAAASLAPVTPPTTPVPTAAAALAQMRPATPSETMKVFGMRQKPAPRIGGKPRYLGLILTAVLVAVLVLVAIWAAMLVDPAPPRVGLDDPPPSSQALAAAQGSEEQASVHPTEAFVSAAPDTLPAPDLEVSSAPPSAPQTASPTDTAAPTLPQVEALPQDTPSSSPAAPGQANTDTPPKEAPVLQEPDAQVATDTPGRLQPTPEGVITPEGISLFAARPDPVPPRRPENLTPTTSPEAEATAAPPVDAPQVATPGSTVALPPPPQTEPETGPFQPNEAAPKTRPPVRPQSVTQSQTETTTDTTAAPATAPQAQATPPEALLDLVTRRPPARGANITAAAKAAADAQTQQANQIAAAAAAAAAAASTLGQTSQQAALMPTVRPTARPSSLQPAIQPTRTAPPHTTPQTRSAPDPEEEDEPEIAPRTTAPRIPTQASVARQATVSQGLDLGRMNLIGVFGTSNNRVALVRDGRGRLSRVRVGDRLDGGQVTAISASELSYRKGRSDHRLQMPRS